MKRKLIAVAVLGPVIGLLFLACAPKPTAAPDDGWSPKLAPATAAADARSDENRPSPPGHELAAELADASDDDLAAAFRQRVTPVGPRHWRVERQAIDILTLHDSSLLLRGFRFVPDRVDGAAAGMRIFGVRHDGIGTLVGLQNGDRLQTVNGTGLGVDEVPSIHASLQRASRIELVVVRAGQPLTLTYDLVDSSP